MMAHFETDVSRSNRNDEKENIPAAVRNVEEPKVSCKHWTNRSNETLPAVDMKETASTQLLFMLQPSDFKMMLILCRETRSQHMYTFRQESWTHETSFSNIYLDLIFRYFLSDPTGRFLLFWLNWFILLNAGFRIMFCHKSAVTHTEFQTRLHASCERAELSELVKHNFNQKSTERICRNPI